MAEFEISGRFIDGFLFSRIRQRYTELQAKFDGKFSAGRINGRRVQLPRVGASAPLPHWLDRHFQLAAHSTHSDCVMAIDVPHAHGGVDTDIFPVGC